MALSVDAFQAASRPRRAECGVAKVLASLDAKDHAVLVGVLADENVTHSAIELVLTENGYTVKQSTVARHRRGGCACAR